MRTAFYRQRLKDLALEGKRLLERIESWPQWTSIEFSGELEVHQLKGEEVRRGWVRIEENTRNRIKSGSLIMLKCRGKRTTRIVIGVPPRYLGIHGIQDKVFMDEVTREDLDFFGNSYEGKTQKFTIRRPSWLEKWFWLAPQFYWSHPDFPVNFASKVALVSLMVSVIAILVTIFG